HGVAGSFDLPLSLTASTPTIEPRQGPAQNLVFTFDKNITSASAIVTEGTATIGSLTYSASTVVVPLTGVNNQQYVTVGLSSVVASDGGSGGTASVRVGFLLGDVNASRVVTLGDLAIVNGALAQAVSAANFTRDANVSGTLTLADKAVANANLTKSLPAP
ncbi:MAG: hypothetical protein IT519_06430, partial [Burkholderiales bacterium]|nr:hypothetical protein [Burkholderiales bacterium]